VGPSADVSLGLAAIAAAERSESLRSVFHESVESLARRGAVPVRCFVSREHDHSSIPFDGPVDVVQHVVVELRGEKSRPEIPRFHVECLAREHERHVISLFCRGFQSALEVEMGLSFASGARRKQKGEVFG
jgi:hypothetical protein